MRLLKKINNSLILSTFALSLCAYTGVVKAETVHTDLAKQSAEYVAELLNRDYSDEKITLTPKRIDPRIAIISCDWQFAVANDDIKKANIPVAVSCPDDNWRIYTYVEAKVLTPVIVAQGQIDKGQVITRNNLKRIYVETNKIRRSVFQTFDAIIGSKTQRRISDESFIQPQHICFVCEGDMVNINANMLGLSIQTQGIAMENGSIGETIEVKNTRSKKRIFVKVSGVAQVSALL